MTNPQTTFVIGGESMFAASVSVRCGSPVRARGVRPGIGPPPERCCAEQSKWAFSSSIRQTPTARASQSSSTVKLSDLRRPPHCDQGRLRTQRVQRLVGERRADRLDPNGRPGHSAPPARHRCSGSSSTASISTSCTPPTQPSPSRSRSARSKIFRTRARSGTSASPMSLSSNSPSPEPSLTSPPCSTDSTSATAAGGTYSTSARRTRSDSSPTAPFALGSTPHTGRCSRKRHRDSAQAPTRSPSRGCCGLSRHTAHSRHRNTRAPRRQPCSRRASPRPRRDTRDHRSGQPTLPSNSLCTRRHAAGRNVTS